MVPKNKIHPRYTCFFLFLIFELVLCPFAGLAFATTDLDQRLISQKQEDEKRNKNESLRSLKSWFKDTADPTGFKKFLYSVADKRDGSYIITNLYFDLKKDMVIIMSGKLYPDIDLEKATPLAGALVRLKYALSERQLYIVFSDPSLLINMPLYDDVTLVRLAKNSRIKIKGKLHTPQKAYNKGNPFEGTLGLALFGDINDNEIEVGFINDLGKFKGVKFFPCDRSEEIIKFCPRGDSL